MDCINDKPGCKLGMITKHIQLRGESASVIPCTEPEAPSHHKIMVILKSPDIKDKITIGTGRNVDKLKDLLAMSTIDPRDVYVTALVKCCPPQRDPAVSEIKACVPHLVEELKAVDPEVIILMGGAALRTFNLMGQGGVNKLHGEVLHKKFPHDESLTKEYQIVVTSDPNALYMNPDPRLESTIIKDLRLAASAVKGSLINTFATPTRYKLIESLDDLDWMINKIKRRGMFAFDTESRALPWYKEPMICAQFSWGYDTKKESTAVLPIYKHDPKGADWKLKAAWSPDEKVIIKEKLKEIFENKEIPKAAHNIGYDMCVLFKHLGIRIHGFLFDTMLMHHVLWEHPPHDLEYLSDIEFHTGNYSKDVHAITGHGNVLKNPYDHVPDDILWPYGAKDSENVYRLMWLYFSRMKKRNHLWKLYQEETYPFIRTLFRAEWYGVALDPNVIDDLSVEYSQEEKDLLIRLKEETWPEFNPKSSEHVMKAITNAGFWDDIQDFRRAKGYSTEKKTLLKLAPKLPLVEDIMRHRALVKLTSNYLNNAKKLAIGDGRARISFKIHGTVNGRPSAPFLHQIPRLDHNRIAQGKRNLRDMFVARKGYKIVYADFSQLELVVLAIQSGDESMLNVFKSGEDIHAATAAAFLDINVDQVNKFNRSGIGKPVNFGRTYGSIDGYALKKLTWMDDNGKEHPVTDAMIQRGFKSLDARFPAVNLYFADTVLQIIANKGTYVTRFGREKHMGATITQGNEWARKEAERQAVNGSIQSPACSVTIRFLNDVEDFLQDSIRDGVIADEDAFLVLTVHDSGAWEVKEEHVEWFEKNLRGIANRPVPQLDNYVFKVEVGVGDSWTEAELNAQ